MKKSTRTASGAAVALGAGAVLALVPALSASAHVTASASSTAAGSYTVVTFSVPHGCDGSPTIGIEIEIPDTVRSVTPTVNPSWSIATTTAPLEGAVADDHGEAVSERLASVVYTANGDGLPDGYRDTVALSLQLPDGDAGDVIAFPVTQTCAEGTAEWVGDDAPSVTLTAAAAGDAGHGHGDDQGDGHASEHEDPVPTAAGDDVLARVLGAGGLVVGAVGVALAIVARRDAKRS